MIAGQGPSRSGWQMKVSTSPSLVGIAMSCSIITVSFGFRWQGLAGGGGRIQGGMSLEWESPRLSRCFSSRAFSSEVDAGSREENASKQKARATFRFYRNVKCSSAGDHD